MGPRLNFSAGPPETVVILHTGGGHETAAAGRSIDYRYAAAGRVGTGGRFGGDLRYAASYPEVFMVLSGMGSMEMMQSNINTMYPFVPLSAAELETTDRVREIIREYNQIPCTKCRYCAEVCPKNVPIADLFAVYNEYALARMTKREARAGFDAFDVKAADCIECGKCEKICPQSIAIREGLKKLVKM